MYYLNQRGEQYFIKTPLLLDKCAIKLHFTEKNVTAK
jgi:hypothetical protein